MPNGPSVKEWASQTFYDPAHKIQYMGLLEKSWASQTFYDQTHKIQYMGLLKRVGLANVL